MQKLIIATLATATLGKNIAVQNMLKQHTGALEHVPKGPSSAPDQARVNMAAGGLRDRIGTGEIRDMIADGEIRDKGAKTGLLGKIAKNGLQKKNAKNGHH